MFTLEVSVPIHSPQGFVVFSCVWRESSSHVRPPPSSSLKLFFFCLQIFNLMKFDSYSRFLKSSLYQECVHAEQDGRSLPDPYQIPCSPAPSKHSASSDRSTLSTPKKVQTAVR